MVVSLIASRTDRQCDEDDDENGLPDVLFAEVRNHALAPCLLNYVRWFNSSPQLRIQEHCISVGIICICVKFDSDISGVGNSEVIQAGLFAHSLVHESIIEHSDNNEYYSRAYRASVTWVLPNNLESLTRGPCYSCLLVQSPAGRWGTTLNFVENSMVRTRNEFYEGHERIR